MNNKAIIWRRGSTDRQEIITQGEDLTAIALSEGFRKKDLIMIGEAGASAIKQNDRYLKEVNELLNTLKNDSSVKTVFVWEISRLARNELAFYQMKDFLIKNKVQLICKTPSLRLFDSNGTVNKGTELTLSLLVTLAKQEMEIKFERFKRGKERNRREGRYNGGKIKLGYTVDKDNHFILDEENAGIVRNMFNLYLNEGYSANAIWRYYVERGHYTVGNTAHGGSKHVIRILKDYTYAGSDPHYPAIVDKDTVDRAVKRMATFAHRRTTKHIFYAGHILKDKETGTTLSARMGNLSYVMRWNDRAYSLSINVIDYITWFVASYLKVHDLGEESKKNRTEYALKIKENNGIISNKETQIKEKEAIIDRAINANIMQPLHFPTERMNAVIGAVDKDIVQLRSDITALKTDNQRMQNVIDGIDRKETAINFTDDYSDAMKKEIINDVIQEIQCEIIDRRGHYRLTFINKVGLIDNSWWEYTSNNNKVRIVQHLQLGQTLDLTGIAAKNKRFKRNR